MAAGDYTVAAEDKPAVAVTEAATGAWGPGRDGVRPALPEGLGRRGDRRAAAVVASARVPCPVRASSADATDLFASLRSGEIDVAWTSTAAPGVPSDVVVLSDKTALIRAENLVPLYRRNVLGESQVLALNEIAGVLDTGSLADMRRKVAEGADPGSVAGQWLDAHPLGTSN